MADARLFMWRGWQPVLALFLCMLTTACGAGTALDVFFAPPPDIGARLPVNGIFPQGRTLAFMGVLRKPCA